MDTSTLLCPGLLSPGFLECPPPPGVVAHADPSVWEGRQKDEEFSVHP